jgi:uncharacterized protein (DUF1015 family)
MLISPFRALRPKTKYTQNVVAPPYDVVSTEEARQIYENNKYSFIAVSRPEVTLKQGVDPYSEEVYKKGKENLDLLISKGLLEREDKPCLYIYRIETDNHTQTGLSLVASVNSYLTNRIKKHELTRPIKENDRVNNISYLNTQTGPVLGVYKDDTIIKSLLNKIIDKTSPVLEAKGPNSSNHTIWKIDNNDLIKIIIDQIEAHDSIYIADGHHRSAAAAIVASRRSDSNLDSHSHFLMTIFPESEMLIYDYNRVIHPDEPINEQALLSYLDQLFDITSCNEPSKPNNRYNYGMYLNKNWYRLSLKQQDSTLIDPVAALDVSVIQDAILSSYFGITDPRVDPRISFVGGVRGMAGIEMAVNDKPNGIGFSLFATSMSQLMAVADAEKLMPPKSTWFEPKLLDGLLSHVLD